MRKKIAAANWKMHCTLTEATALAERIAHTSFSLSEHQEVVICPPFVYLMMLRQMLQQKPHFHVGAQNCFTESSGAYTGEISASMLASIGVEYVIIGHSERRQYFGETSGMLARKLDVALQHGLKPIFCCGEPLEVRQQEAQNAYVLTQLKESLFHLSAEQLARVIIAYEPIWAIGTGLNATPHQTQQMHAFIRHCISEQYGTQPAQDITILYGGSLKASNAAELFACPDVDGGLVGGASLKAEEFTQIINALSAAH